MHLLLIFRARCCCNDFLMLLSRTSFVYIRHVLCDMTHIYMLNCIRNALSLGMRLFVTVLWNSFPLAEVPRICRATSYLSHQSSHHFECRWIFCATLLMESFDKHSKASNISQSECPHNCSLNKQRSRNSNSSINSENDSFDNSGDRLVFCFVDC